MLLQQILEQSKRPRVGGIGLGGSNETSRGVLILALARQGDPQILVGIGPLWINFKRLPAVDFALRELAQSVERKSQIIVDEIPGEGVRRLQG